MNRDSPGSQVTEPAAEPPGDVTRRLDVRRIYPALVFAPLFYLLVRHFPPVFFFILVTLTSLLALWEFYRVYFLDQAHLVMMTVGLGLTCLLLAAMQWSNMAGLISVGTLTIFIVLTCFMLKPSFCKQLTPPSIAIPFGSLYIGLGLGHFLLIRQLEDGDLLVFFVLLVSWAADTGAYYAGVTMGRLQLAPRLSPRKTVEGFIGGLLFSIIIAGACRFWFVPSFSLTFCVMIGILLSGMGLLGDLTESSFKRSSGVKDSGSLIPGHGGVLDRVDSLLFTAPTFYYSFIFTQPSSGF